MKNGNTNLKIIIFSLLYADDLQALKLRENKFGTLYHVKKTNAIVWTADRRIQMDGGLLKGIIKRIKRLFGFSTEARTDL